MAQEKLITLNKLTDFWNKLKEKLGQGINPTTNNTGSIGTNSLKWKDIYATDFHGNLSGNANTAAALTSNAGSTSQPIYFSNGKPVAITGAIDNNINSMGWTAADPSTAKNGTIKINGENQIIYDTCLYQRGTPLESTTESPKDLNDYKTPGVYYSNNSTESATIINSPITSSGFRLTTFAGYQGISSRSIQTAVGSGLNIAYRHLGASNTSPTEWQMVAHSKHGTAVGSNTQPVYVTGSGVTTACTKVNASTIDVGGTAYTLRTGTSGAAGYITFVV